VSAVADEPRDALRHGQRVVNTVGRDKKAENRLTSEYGPGFQGKYPYFLEIPESILY